MLDKTMYDSWESRMFLYIKGKKNGRMMLESIENGPLVYPTVEKEGQIRKKKYAKLTEQEQLQVDYDVQVTNIVLQCLPSDVYSLVNHSRNMYTTNYDQLYTYLNQHEGHANEVRMMRKRYPDPLALVANYQTQTSSNLRNQATIQDGRVTVQQVQGTHGQGFAGMVLRKQDRALYLRIIVHHRPKDQECCSVKEKLMLAKRILSVLMRSIGIYSKDLGIAYYHDIQPTIIHNAAFQTDDLDAYNSDYDDISFAKVVLMANLSSYSLDVLSESQNMIVQDSNSYAQQDAMIMSVFE
ncbi:hypothetical protein Tco_1321430 [Tanacetum coccineum]